MITQTLTYILTAEQNLMLKTKWLTKNKPYLCKIICCYLI